MTVKILALSGSNRQGSYNQRVLDIAVRGAVEAGASVTPIRLLDFKLPFYDTDEETRNGVPDGAHALHQLVAEHDALLIATPEYNGGYTALLKNAVDWMSRPRQDGTPGTALLAGKVAALVSASPGLFGGIRSQAGMRTVLEKLGMLIIPQTFALSVAHEAFTDSGAMGDANVEALLMAVGKALASMAQRLK